jgi:glycosyltransferase involved in cell wall biosynthesis
MKLLIVKSAVESKWGSCKVISPNLHQLYLGLGKPFSIEWFSLHEDLLKSELQTYDSSIDQLLQYILKSKPDRLVFVDHLPPPPKVLAYLSLLTNLKKLPPIIFHVYGDFTYFAREWSYLNEILIDHPVTFIVASSSQKKLVNTFLGQPESASVAQLCFPVNEEEYYFDSKERSKFRNEHGLSEDDRVILYSGRVSLQKNVDVLIKEFLKLKKPTAGQYHLWIAGAFDDVGADFIGYESYHGYMFSKIQSLLEGAPSAQRSRIKFWGQQGKNNLRKIKSASDLFASFSLYHDEDYGMSPAEALACGLPSVLTDWGGYSSFVDSASEKKSPRWNCQLVPVELSEYGSEIVLDTFQTILKNFTPLKSSERLAHSRAFMDYFSISSNRKVLASILKTDPVEFKGFHWLLEQHATALNLNWSKTKFNKFLSPKKDGYYHDIYQNYISGMSHEK